MKKVREKPKSLCVMECLRGRMAFSKEEERSYWQGVRGYEGECCFDSFTKDFVTLNDITIKDGPTAQLDALILTESAIHLFDIKNFEGPLSIFEGAIYQKNEKLVNNPLERLERAKTLLERKLGKHAIRVPVLPHLVFINPDMVFYGHHPSLPILLYQQISPYLEKIYTGNSYHAERLATTIWSFHTDENPYEAIQMMQYKFDSLEKGIFCPTCRVPLTCVSSRSVGCAFCHFRETKTQGVLRNLVEYRILFPERKISVSQIQKWCDNQVSRKAVQAILAEQMGSSQ